MKTRASIHIVVALAALVAMRAPATAQPRDPSALKAEVERRFDVLPLRDGIALHPKRVSDVQSIEIASGVIAVDGQPATGAELRSRLGADADLVIALSYMSDTERRGLFAIGVVAQSTPPAAPAPAVPAAPEPPAAVERPDPPPPPDPPRRRTRRGGNDDLVRIGQGVTVADGDVVDGGVVAIGGPVRILGEVHGDAVAVGGSMELGPNASVDGDVVVVGGRLTRADGARVSGGVREVGISGLGMGNWNWGNLRDTPFGPGAILVGSSLNLLRTLMHLAILCLLAAVVMLMGRPYAERVGARAVAEPLKAGAIGFLAQILFLPVFIIVCVLLVITIIGIPLLLLMPFVVLGLMIVGLVGFTGVAYQAGRWLASRFSWADDNPYATTFIGVALVLAPLFVARLTGFGGGFLFPLATGILIAGLLIEYAAWTVGFGAVALTRFSPLPPSMVGSSSASGPSMGGPIVLEGQGPTIVGP